MWPSPPRAACLQGGEWNPPSTPAVDELPGTATVYAGSMSFGARSTATAWGGPPIPIFGFTAQPVGLLSHPTPGNMVIEGVRWRLASLGDARWSSSFCMSDAHPHIFGSMSRHCEPCGRVLNMPATHGGRDDSQLTPVS
jgi:hypothetical protein